MVYSVSEKISWLSPSNDIRLRGGGTIALSEKVKRSGNITVGGNATGTFVAGGGNVHVGDIHNHTSNTGPAVRSFPRAPASPAARVSSPDGHYIFISYAPEDEAHRNALVKHLATLRREGLIATWHDGCLLPGQRRSEEIAARLKAATMMLFLISADFLASDNRWAAEMDPVLERATRGDALVVPILLRPCDWRTAAIGELEPLPSSGTAVTSWGDPDSAWVDVVAGLRRLITER